MLPFASGLGLKPQVSSYLQITEDDNYLDDSKK